MTYQETLSNNLIYVRFSIAMWSAKVSDKSEARASEDNAQAERKTRRVWRDLCKPEIHAIHSKGRALRKFIDDESYSMGLLSGVHKAQGKLFTSENWDRVESQIATEYRELAEMISAFCTQENFEAMIERDLKRQGRNANRNDYPENLEMLRDKFSLDIKVGKFTPSSAILFDMLETTSVDMEKEYEARAKEMIDNLTRDNFERMKEPLQKLSESMAGYGAKGSYFKQATLDEVERIVTVMEGFNFSNDPRVTEIITEVRDSLSGLDGKSLRKNESDRERVERKASEIVEKIESYF